MEDASNSMNYIVMIWSDSLSCKRVEIPRLAQSTRKEGTQDVP